MTPLAAVEARHILRWQLETRPGYLPGTLVRSDLRAQVWSLTGERWVAGPCEDDDAYRTSWGPGVYFASAEDAVRYAEEQLKIEDRAVAAVAGAMRP